jgi:hypothetical protein
VKPPSRAALRAAINPALAFTADLGTAEQQQQHRPTVAHRLAMAGLSPHHCHVLACVRPFLTGCSGLCVSLHFAIPKSCPRCRCSVAASNGGDLPSLSPCLTYSICNSLAALHITTAHAKGAPEFRNGCLTDEYLEARSRLYCLDTERMEITQGRRSKSLYD